MSSEELKPCPFCGGDVSFHKDEECPGCHLVQCGQCRAFFDFAAGADPGNDCDSVDALRSAIAPMWNTRAQLAAIQGGMGEAEAEKQLQEWARDKFTYTGRYKGSVYGNTDWALARAINTDLLAHYQRITAAMAAEVATWRSNSVMLEQANAGLAQLNGKLRAELAEVKGREAACFVVGKLEKTAVIDSPLPVGTKLYASPPASPDVEGLVKALEEIERRNDNPARFDAKIDHIVTAALSAWRQAHTPSTLPASSAEE